METPGTPGAGITGAVTVSLGSDSLRLPDAGTSYQARIRLARDFDREADRLLAEGQHVPAERLAWRAADLREVAP